MKRIKIFGKTSVLRDKETDEKLYSRKHTENVGDVVIPYDECETVASVVRSSTSIDRIETIETEYDTPLALEKCKSEREKSELKVNLSVLRDRITKTHEEIWHNEVPGKGKLRAINNMDVRREELKQLEDPPQTSLEKELCAARLQYSFYNTSCEILAENLLGKILVRRLENGTILKGRIVETEGYLGTIDRASHTYEKKITPRNIPMYMPPGTIYVYMTYGMYHCFNISSEGDGCAVLVRAVDPTEGISYMEDHRNCMMQRKTAAKKARKDFKRHQLCNGPSKLCMAYQLDKNHSRYSMCTWKGLWLENDTSSDADVTVVRSKRIGIESCGPEWANKLLRYYIFGNKSVSKRDKRAEALLGLQ